MPFGLHSASATFQRALDQVRGPEMMPHAFAYQDDSDRVDAAGHNATRKVKTAHISNLKSEARRLPNLLYRVYTIRNQPPSIQEIHCPHESNSVTILCCKADGTT